MTQQKTHVMVTVLCETNSVDEAEHLVGTIINHYQKLNPGSRIPAMQVFSARKSFLEMDSDEQERKNN